MILQVLEELKERLKTIKNGSFKAITYQRELKVKKEFKDNYTVVKITSGVYRLGILNSHKKINEGKELQPMKWGESQGLHLIVHNDKYYLRVHTTNNHKLKSKTVYFVNGKEMSKQELEELGILYKGELESKKLDCGFFTINIENIVKI